MLLIFLLLFAAGCGTSQEPAVPGTDPAEEDTGETVPEDAVSEDAETSGAVYFAQLKYDPETGSLIYTVVNGTDERITFGGDIILKKRTIDGLWVEMQPLQWNREESIRFPVTRLVQIDAGEAREGSIDLENTFGKLTEGEYEVIIQIGTSQGSETISGGFRVGAVN